MQMPVLQHDVYNPQTGQSTGEIGAFGSRFDTDLWRPFYNRNGVPCVTVNTGKTETRKADGKLICNKSGSPIHFPVRETVSVRDIMRYTGYSNPVMNATALRKDEWIKLDNIVLEVARKRLRAWADLAAANPLTFNGFGKRILEHETMSDPGSAMVSMDALEDGRADAPKFQLEGTPLPITHSNFTFSERTLEISRNSGSPLDSIMARVAGRRVAEHVEKTLIGEVTGMTDGVTADYGRAATAYGYTNFPARVTKTNMTAPTGSNGPSVLSSWLALRDLMYAQNFYGPFMVYTSNDWDQYLDNLFSTTEPSAGTLRKRLLEIDGISGIRRLDYLDNTFTVLFVQMDPEVAQAVIGMDLRTIQWEAKGGFQKMFKVMTIMVPRLRADYNGQCGIGHGTTA